MHSESVGPVTTKKVQLKLVNNTKPLAARIRKTAADVGRVSSFSELAALVLARRYDAIGRKKDARRILTSYLQYHKSTQKIATALSCYS